VFTTAPVADLVIDSEDLTLTDPFPVAGTSARIQATERNIGQILAGAHNIEFRHNGAFVSEPDMSAIPAGGRATASSSLVNFPSCGLNTISAEADSENEVTEGSAGELNNIATKDVQVYPGGPDNVTTYNLVTYPDVTSDIQTVKSWVVTGNVAVRGATVTFVQGEDLCDKHFIKVLGTGTLTLEDAVIQSNAKLVIYVGDNATLDVRNTALSLNAADGEGQLYLDGDGIVRLEDVTLTGSLIANSPGATLTARRVTFAGESLYVDTQETTELWDPVFTSVFSSISLLSDDGNTDSIDFDIRNATFGDALTDQLVFRGTQAVEMTSVDLSTDGNWWESMVEGSAKASRYWWLTVRAVDGTNTVIENVDLELTLQIWDEQALDWRDITPFPGPDDLYFIDRPDTDWAVTTMTGSVDYRAISEVRFGDAPHWSNASFRASGVVNLEGQQFPDENVSMLVIADSTLELVFSDLTPDFSIDIIRFSGLNTAVTTQNQQPVGTEVDITVTIRNAGALNASNVEIVLYATHCDTNNNGVFDPTVPEAFRIGSGTVTVPRRGTVDWTLTWLPVSVTSPTICGMVDRFLKIPETNEFNNILAQPGLVVMAWPDLSVSAGDVQVFNPTEGNPTFVEVVVRNSGTGTSASGSLELFEAGVGSVATVSFGGISPNGGTQLVNVTWFPSVQGFANLSLIVDAECAPAADPSVCDYNPLNNEVHNLTVVVLTQPDLFLIDSDLDPFNMTTISSASLTVPVHNLGTTAALDVEIAVFVETNTTAVAMVILGEVRGASDATAQITGIAIGVVGTWDLTVVVDPDNKIAELDETNNAATVRVNVGLPDVKLFIDAPDSFATFNTGQIISVTGRVLLQATSAPVEGAEIVLRLRDSDLIIRSDNTLDPAVSGPDGIFQGTIAVPDLADDADPETYTLEAAVLGSRGEVTSQVFVTLEPTPTTDIPWLLIIILIVIVAALIGAIAYVKFYRLGKTMECGNCGSFIPEDAEKCPVCGVEFEKDMAKCSNCSSWIPLDVKACPECNVEFTTGEIDVAAHEQRQKESYAKVAARYRRQGEREAGRKLSDDEFDDWWQTKPTYVSMEDWMREEQGPPRSVTAAVPRWKARSRDGEAAPAAVGPRRPSRSGESAPLPSSARPPPPRRPRRTSRRRQPPNSRRRAARSPARWSADRPSPCPGRPSGGRTRKRTRKTRRRPTQTPRRRASPRAKFEERSSSDASMAYFRQR
jgi:RNA polymerase subunit RPABC4/transcription elongation factor Spt4